MPNLQKQSNISSRLRMIPEGIGITVVDHADAELYGNGSLYWEVTRERLWAGGLRSGVPAMTGLAAPSRPALGVTVARALKAAGLGGSRTSSSTPATWRHTPKRVTQKWLLGS